jgi:uncharacterized protein (TIGR01777 family)
MGEASMYSSRVFNRFMVNHSIEETFDWYLRPGFFERLLPPWEDVKAISYLGYLGGKGDRFIFDMRKLGLLRSKWVIELKDIVPNELIKFVQIEGPFKSWEYTTRVTSNSEHSCEVIDQINFSCQMPKICCCLIECFWQKRSNKFSTYKRDLINNDLDLFTRYRYEQPLRILVSSSNGFIGKAVYNFLRFAGHDVWRLVRAPVPSDKKSILWDPNSGKVNREKLEGFDAVVYLVGKSMAKERWTEQNKKAILLSRYKSTERLVRIFKELKDPPKTFLCASGTGYYGSRGKECVDEQSASEGGLFLSAACQYVERAARDLEEIGVRVIPLRMGMALSASGGVIKRLLPSFVIGLGSKMGSGQQYMSWIALDDIVGAIYHILMTPTLHGAVNLVSPHPVTNAEFALEFSKCRGRWLGPPLPASIVRLLLRQKGEEFWLNSIRALPSRLLETGYVFFYPKIRQALEHVL